MNYPEPMLPHYYCHVEGHDFGDGGICFNCGYRLRCHVCGCFQRVDRSEAHFAEKHARRQSRIYTFPEGVTLNNDDSLTLVWREVWPT